MFVDDLPNMPKVYGYKVVDGVPKSKSLKIGMFKKKWVSAVFFWFKLLITNFSCESPLFVLSLLYHAKFILYLFR